MEPLDQLRYLLRRSKDLLSIEDFFGMDKERLKAKMDEWQQNVKENVVLPTLPSTHDREVEIQGGALASVTKTYRSETLPLCPDMIVFRHSVFVEKQSLLEKLVRRGASGEPPCDRSP